MKVYIPDMHTDFAYSAGAEEYGLMLSIGLIALFMLLVIRGLYKSMKLSDPFEQVASAGLFVLVGMQAFINVAVNPRSDPHQGHDPAVHQLWWLVDAGHGPDHGSRPVAHSPPSGRLCRQRQPGQGRRLCLTVRAPVGALRSSRPGGPADTCFRPRLWRGP